MGLWFAEDPRLVVPFGEGRDAAAVEWVRPANLRDKGELEQSFDGWVSPFRRRRLIPSSRPGGREETHIGIGINRCTGRTCTGESGG